MAAPKIQFVFEVDGVSYAIDRMHQFENAVNRMDSTVSSSTGHMAREAAAALGRMASEHNHMASTADKAAGSAVGANGRMKQSLAGLSDQINHNHGKMSAWEKTLWDNQMRLMNLTMALGLVTAAFLAVTKAADTQTNIASKIKLVTDSATEQLAVNQRLYDLAQSTRSQNEATVDLYTRLARFTKELNLTQNELYRVTESVNKSITISGGSAASAQAAIIQFNQAMASGTLRGEELNSVLEQAPRLAEAIAKGLGVPIGELRKLGETGQLTSEQVVRALLSQSNAIDAEYAKMTVTVAQAGTIFVNALGRYIGQADQATGATSRIAAGIVYLADNVDKLDVVVNGVVITGQALLPILGDILTLTKGIVQAAGEIPGLLHDAPGIVTAIGVAAYYAIGGVAGLTAGFTALTAAITASMATNPVGWAMGIGAAFYLAAKPAVKALDEIIYKYTQLNLTGEAMYNAEMKRAAEADKAWENAKQKALWMYKEGGILPSSGMQKELGITGGDVKPPAPEDTEAIKRYNDYVKEYNRLQDERIKLQIRENPYLNELAKSLVEIDVKYKDLIARYPEHRAELQRNMELDKKNVLAINEKKEAYDALRDSIKALEQASALEADATSQGMRWNLRNQDYLGWKPKNQKPSLLGSASSGFNQSGEDWSGVENLVKELNGSAEVEKFLEQLKQIEQWAERFPERASEAANAALALKDKIQSMTGLDQLIRENAELSDSLIDDPYARQMAQIKTRYEFERAEIEKTRAKFEKGTDADAELIKRLALLKQEYDRDTAQVANDSYQSQLAMAGEYTGMAGQFFSALAGTMDTSSRSGFESAKSMQLAGAIVSTAAAVMLQMSGGDPYSAWARAAAAAAMGAIQIYTIASTQFGGGAKTPTVSSGSFGGGGGAGSGAVGSRIGAPITSIQDQQTQESMRNLAASMDNASLAIGRVADGLVEIKGLFESGQGGLAVKSAPNMYTQVGEASNGFMNSGSSYAELSGFGSGAKNGAMIGSVAGPIGAIIGGAIGGFISVTSGMFGHGPKTIERSGVVLGMDDGSLEGQSYQEWKKKGGWFRKDKTGVDYSEIDAGFLSTMQTYVDKIEATINRSAVVMSTSVDLSKVDVADTKIATAGRKPEDVAKDLEAWLQTVGDEMAKNVVGLRDFAFYGENAFDALVRLSTSLQGVNEELELIGARLIDSTLQGADAAYRLADAFGGLDELQDAVGEYFDTMFTESEQKALTAAQAQRQVNVAFAEMGVSVPGTREQFQRLVNSLDLTTDSGAATFQALMNISSAAGTLYDQAEEFAQNTRTMTNDLHSRLLRLNGNTGAADIYDLMVSQEKELQDARDNGLDVTQLLIVQQRELAQAVEETGKTFSAAQQQLIDAQQKLVDATRSAVLETIGYQEQILNTIKTLQTGPLALLSPEAAYRQTRDQFAKSDLKSMSGNATAFLEASKGYNASGAQYQADREWVLSVLGNAAGIGSDPTLDAANAQLNVLTEIKTLINDGNIGQLTLLKEQLGGSAGLTSLLTEYLASNQQALQVAQEAANSAKAAAEREVAISTAKSTWDSAVDNYLQDYNKFMASPTYTSVGGRYGQSYAPQWDWSQLAALTEGLKPAYNAALQTGVDPSVLKSIYEETMQKTMPSFAVGTAGLESDMVIQAHQYEKIIDPQSSQILSKYGIKVTGGDNAETIAELKKVIAELQALVRLQGAANQQLINQLAAVEARLAELTSKARLAAAA